MSAPAQADGTDQPLVSIVMATKNAERYLEEALASIARQTYRNYELVVVDAHSADRTASIVAAQPRSRLLRQRGTGFADAWNEGVAAARADLIAFIDSDDRWPPERLARQAAHLGANPGHDAVIGRVKFFLDEGLAAPPGFKPDILEGDRLGYMTGTLLARRRLFEALGPFEAQWEIASDLVWFQKLRECATPLGMLDAVVLEKRIHASNLSYLATRTPVFKREIVQLLHDAIRRRRRAQ
jgi:glycosyltransferase involved in cell wall biosynthesis